MKSFWSFSAGTAMAVAALLSLSAPARANLVLNPDFDDDSPAPRTAPLDWTLTPAASGSDFFVGPGQTYGSFSSPNAAVFAATGSTDDSLSQVLVTVPGQNYTLSFELAHDTTDTANDFSVLFGGDEVLSLVNASAFGYTLYTFNVEATSAATDLVFNGREVPAYYDLDNVDVEAVPEPMTLALLGAGLAGAAGIRRRKKI